MPDWLYILARALLLILLVYTAYVSFRRVRAERRQGRRMTTYDWLTLAAGLPLLGVGPAIVLMWAAIIMDWPTYLAIMLVILYCVPAFVLFAVIARHIEARFPPPKSDTGRAGKIEAG